MNKVPQNRRKYTKIHSGCGNGKKDGTRLFRTDGSDGSRSHDTLREPGNDQTAQLRMTKNTIDMRELACELSDTANEQTHRLTQPPCRTSF